MIPGVVGWDIGGVNTKAARLVNVDPSTARTISIPYEIQRDPSALPAVLRSAAREIEASSEDQHAITMTAELSQAFRTKREGVAFILDAIESVFPLDRLHVYTVTGEFVSPPAARYFTREVAASNWAATAQWVARQNPTCLLIDIGTTTADLIPIVEGNVRAEGKTDPERLLAGELVYTGALRTPVEAVGRQVPLWQGSAGVAAEGFALMGDVYLWLGQLTPDDYSCPTPDSRPATREYAGERLARVVCGDRDLLDDDAIDRIARALARAQRELLVEAVLRLRRRHSEIETAVTAGLGEFLGAEAARPAGLKAVSLAGQVGAGALTAPALAVACLLHESLAVQP